jgi:predicted 3-demethylubiquinone-9 3-methyltransferase (glyoxalase superfamily)
MAGDLSQRITVNFWFDTQAEDAARFYAGIFRRSSVGSITRYSKEAAQVSGMPEGSVMTVQFELDGQTFVGLNGGPHFRFNEALSLVIDCETQDEVDHYWNALSAGGNPAAQQCGWLKDRYGVSWQVVPTIVPRLMSDPDPDKARRAMAALLKMKKLDIAALEKAAA